jgi:hypothetical protein
MYGQTGGMRNYKLLMQEEEGRCEMTSEEMKKEGRKARRALEVFRAGLIAPTRSLLTRQNWWSAVCSTEDVDIGPL